MDDTPALRQRSLDLYKLGRLDEAEAVARSVLAVDPADFRAVFILSHILLAAGRWSEGWPLLESRSAVRPDNAQRPGVSYPEWTGQPLDGKRLLIWSEQGFGDQIMMSRFLPELRRRAAKVTAICWTPVASLIQHLPDAVIPAEPAAGLVIPKHDYWVRWFSLPGRLGVTPESLPSTPYLPTTAGPKAGVGLMWRTGSTALNAAQRSMPEPLGHGLLADGLVDLEPATTGARDFAETAAIIDRLEAVVTIDTAVAHVAGGMGKRTLLMLPATGVDWRWGPAGDRSVWYPSVEIIRQPEAGDWSSVVAEVRRRLA